MKKIILLLLMVLLANPLSNAEEKEYREIEKSLLYRKLTQLDRIELRIEEIISHIEKLEEKNIKEGHLGTCDNCMKRFEVYRIGNYMFCEEHWDEYQNEGEIALHPSRYHGVYCGTGCFDGTYECSFKNAPRYIKKGEEKGEKLYKCPSCGKDFPVNTWHNCGDVHRIR